MLTPSQAETIGRIRSYLKLNKGRRAGLLKLFETLSNVDVDHLGHLNWKQFCEALTSCGLQIQDVRSLFKMSKKDSGGYVDISEFLRLMKAPMSKQRKEKIDEIFYHLLDKDNDGIVSIEEISKAYMAFRHPDARMGRKAVTQIQQDFVDDLTYFSHDGYFNIESFTSFFDYAYCFEEDVDFMELMKLLWVSRVTPADSVAASLNMETQVVHGNDVKDIFVDRVRKYVKIRGVKGWMNLKNSLKKNAGIDIYLLKYNLD